MKKILLTLLLISCKLPDPPQAPTVIPVQSVPSQSKQYSPKTYWNIATLHASEDSNLNYIRCESFDTQTVCKHGDGQRVSMTVINNELHLDCSTGINSIVRCKSEPGEYISFIECDKIRLRLSCTTPEEQ